MAPGIQDVKNFVYAHITEIHTIKDLAERFGTSADALRMAWRRSGEHNSLAKFLDEVRIVAAELWHTEHPQALCKEIVRGVGLRSLDVASRCCKRVTGQSMREHFRRL